MQEMQAEAERCASGEEMKHKTHSLVQISVSGAKEESDQTSSKTDQSLESSPEERDSEALERT